jgi:hypothetical protein
MPFIRGACITKNQRSRMRARKTYGFKEDTRRHTLCKIAIPQNSRASGGMRERPHNSLLPFGLDREHSNRIHRDIDHWLTQGFAMH